MTARLVSIELERFRGFAQKQVIDLDADVVLIRGDNGSGKTSLADGLLWLITGTLPHLNDRVKGLRQTHDPIHNRYSGGPSRVSLTVRKDDTVWTFVRVGDAKQSEISCFREGQPHSPKEGLHVAFGEPDTDSLAQAVSTWGILRQDAVRSVLDTGGAELHNRMSSVIGLSDVSRFGEASLRATRSLAHDRRRAEELLKRSREARRAAENDMFVRRESDAKARGASIAEALVKLLAAAGGDVRVAVGDIRTLDDVAALGREISDLARAYASAADAYDEYVRTNAAIQQTSLALEKDLASTEAQAARLSQLTSEMQRLAEAALNLLGEHCPVCDQRIDAERVSAKLRSDLEQNRARLIAADEAHKEVALLRQAVIRAQAAEHAREQAAAKLDRCRQNVDEQLRHSQYVQTPSLAGRMDRLAVIAHRLEEMLASLRLVYAEIEASSETAIARLSAALDAARAEEANAQAAFEQFDARHSAAKRLEKATQAAADRIVSRWLRQLEPSFAEVFDRLAPHPTFSELRARQDVYYKRNQIVPEVLDPVTGISANPLLVYSEGQLNTVALSYFLGLALNAPTNSLGFMALDDPLQAMDVLAVLGFADLCRRLRRERQLLITTHDRRYADLLARKLAPREASHRTLTHEFENWSPSGPQVSTRREEFVPTRPILGAIS